MCNAALHSHCFLRHKQLTEWEVFDINSILLTEHKMAGFLHSPANRGGPGHSWGHINDCLSAFRNSGEQWKQIQRHTQGKKIRLFSFGHSSGASSRSEVCCWHINAGFAATFPSDRSVSLLPKRHPVAGADLFGVLQKASGAGDDPADQSGENGVKGLPQRRTPTSIPKPTFPRNFPSLLTVGDRLDPSRPPRRRRPAIGQSRPTPARDHRGVSEEVKSRCFQQPCYLKLTVL